MTKNANDYVYEYLADGTAVDMDVDGSGTSAYYKFTIPSSKTLRLTRLNFSLVDGAMQYGKFGGLSALGNGLKVEILDSAGGTLCDFTGGQPIKANEQFSCLAGVDAIAEPTAGDDFMPVRFTVAKANGPMRLNEGEVIQVVVQDNLSDLSHFRCMIQGTYKE